MRLQVSCINKSDRFDPSERIRAIGGIAAGRRWKLPQPDAIDRIRRDGWSFYVTRNGREIGVVVATSRFGNHYLKTEADGETPNNLLSLPECP